MLQSNLPPRVLSLYSGVTALRATVYLYPSVKVKLDICIPLSITMCNDNRNDPNYLDLVYLCLAKGNSLESVHIPHSDVFYVREALEARYKRAFSLEQTEEYMREAGWSERT